ncbi:MAG: inositol monophosphatase [Actinomycetota bacterium]|nr:inositol monophosphatase [Actinomycetota bacterium]
MPDVAALERLAVRVATEAARLVVDERPDHLSAAATKSSPTDVVTVMDTRAEQLIRERLLQERPQDSILGEEGDDHAGDSEVTWVVDPIDGTVNYLYEIPAYAVSVAAVTGNPLVPGEWDVLAAAVADPCRGVVFHAHRGGGARLSTVEGDVVRTLSVGRVASLAGALVGTGFGYTPARRRVQGELLLELLPQVRDIRRIGSAALDLCMVASGQLDAFYEIGLNPWDLAGGWLVVAEAGGVVSGPGGGPPTDALTVAANPALHLQLAALVDR